METRPSGEASEMVSVMKYPELGFGKDIVNTLNEEFREELCTKAGPISHEWNDSMARLQPFLDRKAPSQNHCGIPCYLYQSSTPASLHLLEKNQ